jgi:hypothetical protein
MPAMKAQAAFTPRSSEVVGIMNYLLLLYPTDVTKVIAEVDIVLVHHRTSGNCGNGHREYVTSIISHDLFWFLGITFELEAA